MTQPNTVNMTFDTSLVEVSPSTTQVPSDYPSALNTSFSTTESDPSDAGLPPSTSRQNQSMQRAQNASLSATTFASPSPKRTATPVKHVETQEAYDQWASVYDTDGNMLQAIDDVELSTLLPDFLSTVTSTRSSSSNAVDVIDLGCGTGRNTTKLVRYTWPTGHNIAITGLDLSAGMLDVAREKLSASSSSAPLLLGEGGQNVGLKLRLEQCDCFPTVSDKSASPMPSISDPPLVPVDALMSTLVLEHVPLRDYFSTVASLLRKSGYALVTNMHSEMGLMSQAGFVNKEGVKVRGKSFAHTVEETVEEARKAGFEVLSARERTVEKDDVESGRVGERGKKWIGVKVWYALVLRKIV